MFTSSWRGFRVPFVEAYSRRRGNKLRKTKDETKGGGQIMAGNPSNKPTWHHRGLLIPGGEDRFLLPNLLLCTSEALQNEITPNLNFSLIWVNLMEISGCCSKSKWALIISPNFTSFSISQHCCCSWTRKPERRARVFLCPLHPLQCSETLVFGELVCVSRKKRRECGMVLIRSLPIYQTLCAARIGVAIWFDRELPGVDWISLAWPEEYILRNNVDTRGPERMPL